MKQQLFGLSFGFIALLFATDMASAQTNQNCAARQTVMDRLSTDFGETRRAMGLASETGVIELFASDETGSWTITITRPNGLTCLIGAGTAFEATRDTLPANVSSPA